MRKAVNIAKLHSQVTKLFNNDSVFFFFFLPFWFSTFFLFTFSFCLPQYIGPYAKGEEKIPRRRPKPPEHAKSVEKSRTPRNRPASVDQRLLHLKQKSVASQVRGRFLMFVARLVSLFALWSLTIKMRPSPRACMMMMMMTGMID